MLRERDGHRRRLHRPRWQFVCSHQGHCVETSVPVNHVIATLDTISGEIAAELGNDGGSCPAGTEATIKTFNSQGEDENTPPAASPRGFLIAFNEGARWNRQPAREVVA